MSENTIVNSSPSTANRQKPLLGVNVAGYFNASSGLGEGGRASVRALEAAHIPFVLNNCNFNLEYHDVDRSFKNFTNEYPHPVNLVQINPDGIFKLIDAFGRGYLENRYSIGYWLWETLRFPPEWYFAFNFFDEIWTSSNFCVESMAAVSSIPVIKIPLAIDLPLPVIGKAHFNLPADKFIFLFIFDFCSAYQRKNPQAVIKSFLQAFGRENEDVLLVVKSSNAEFERAREREMRELSQNAPNIKFIDKILPREEINALIYHADSYVSLHRAEGFGLTIAEAMFYGKPVIATDFSANTDFMNIGNSFPVRYNLIELPEDTKAALYRAGDEWADADTAHAAQMMRLVFENRTEAKRIGERAAADIREKYSPLYVGQQMRNRLERMSSIHNGFAQHLTEETVKEKLRLNRIQLEYTEAQNNNLREKIQMMEDSRFWKIRTQWFKVKRGLGITRKF